MTAISQFTGPCRFLSNFYVEEDGFSAEHFFQARKATALTDYDYVMAAPNPAKAKRRGREILCRPDWELVKNDVMLQVLRTKFGKEPCRAMLLETGGAELVEGNTWHDQYWGNCTCPMHAAVAGENWLGKLLMQVREELQDVSQTNGDSDEHTEHAGVRAG